MAFIRGDDRGAEVGVVPGVYFAVALDEWGVGIQVQNLLGEWAVGSRLGARGQDNGDVECFCDGGMGDHAVTEGGRVVIADLGWGWISFFFVLRRDESVRCTYGVVEAYLQVCYDYHLESH